ncbi:hypothetical protein D5S18_00760 [Nocardia panacis]|uniref:Uncharacterized protein n=1 Tax=Nocardia panacis TaxID=2340916 RepID=A0A3A4KCP6_9NOCA|nr:hypothetical protein D5S18_00760 [Nocardia panacis]
MEFACDKVGLANDGGAEGTYVDCVGSAGGTWDCGATFPDGTKLVSIGGWGWSDVESGALGCGLCEITGGSTRPPLGRSGSKFNMRGGIAAEWICEAGSGFSPLLIESGGGEPISLLSGGRAAKSESTGPGADGALADGSTPDPATGTDPPCCSGEK